MSYVVGTEAATEMVVTAYGVQRGTSLTEMTDLLAAIDYGLDLCGFLTISGLRSIYGERELPPTESFKGEVQVRRLQFASPLQITIDLQPILDFLTTSGYLAFLSMATQIFSDGTTGWRNLQEGLAQSRKNRLARARRRRAKEQRNASIDAPTAEEIVLGDEAEHEAMRKFLNPIVRELLDEYADALERRKAEVVLEEGVRHIESKRAEADRAANILGRREITIRIEYN